MKKTLLDKERAAARRRRRFMRLKNHPFIVPVVTFVVLFFVTIAGFIFLNGRPLPASDSHVIKLSIDGKHQTIPTRAKTVGDLLKRAKITLHENDVVEPVSETAILDDNFHINVYRAKPVTIFDGDKRIQVLSAGTTPRSVAAQAGIKVYPEDNLIITGNDGILKEGVVGQKLVIERSTQVFINLYGTSITVRTHAKTVGELLKDKGVKLSSGDTVQPDQSTPISSSLLVFVIRDGTQLISQEEVIPTPVQYVDDPTLSFGTTAVRQQGSPGKKVVTYQIEILKGKEVSRKVIQNVIATEPVTQIIARGKAIYIPGDTSALMEAAGIASGDYPYVNYIISRESGWCPTKWQGQVGYCPAFYTQLHDPSSGYGFGLCQSTPAIKMATAGSDWSTNPITQLHWCSGYAQGRYGSWGNAYNHWLTYHSW